MLKKQIPLELIEELTGISQSEIEKIPSKKKESEPNEWVTGKYPGEKMWCKY